MRLLLTGATGFVGNVLLDLVPRELPGCPLSALVRPGDPGRARVAAKPLPGLRLIEGDVTDAAQVEAAVRGHTHVVHLAGLISYWRRDRERLQQVNHRGVEHVVRACLRQGVRRLVHVSSVGAIGYRPDGGLADETTPFNWPEDFYYMTSKRAGQQVVERACRESGLQAVILNPASLMGPGDPDPLTPHNQLYARIHSGTLFGCFAGGLAVADVRDLVAIILKALSAGESGESYLVVGDNLPYRRVVERIGECLQRKVYPWPVPPFLLSAAGGVMELASGLTGRRPALTRAYGRLSGWHGYYSNRKSLAAFDHRYLPFEQTIADACAYFKEHHVPEAPRAS